MILIVGVNIGKNLGSAMLQEFWAGKVIGEKRDDSRQCSDQNTGMAWDQGRAHSEK